jgi:hypothetical protein
MAGEASEGLPVAWGVQRGAFYTCSGDPKGLRTRVAARARERRASAVQLEVASRVGDEGVATERLGTAVYKPRPPFRRESSLGGGWITVQPQCRNSAIRVRPGRHADLTPVATDDRAAAPAMTGRIAVVLAVVLAALLVVIAVGGMGEAQLGSRQAHSRPGLPRAVLDELQRRRTGRRRRSSLAGRGGSTTTGRGSRTRWPH